MCVRQLLVNNETKKFSGQAKDTHTIVCLFSLYLFLGDCSHLISNRNGVQEIYFPVLYSFAVISLSLSPFLSPSIYMFYCPSKKLESSSQFATHTLNKKDILTVAKSFSPSSQSCKF